MQTLSPDGRPVVEVVIRDTGSGQDLETIEVREMPFRHVKLATQRLRKLLKILLSRGVLQPPKSRYVVLWIVEARP